MTITEFQIDAVLRAVVKAEESLRTTCGVGDLARAANYSLFHFCRVFQQIAGMSPYDYVMLRRLAIAAQEISNSDESITRIAGDAGFQSPEVFLRAFRRIFGLLPSAWRKANCLPAMNLMPRFTEAHLIHWNTGMSVPHLREMIAWSGWGIGLPTTVLAPEDWLSGLHRVTGQGPACWIAVYDPGAGYVRIGATECHMAPVMWNVPGSMVITAIQTGTDKAELAVDALLYVALRRYPGYRYDNRILLWSKENGEVEIGIVVSRSLQ
jgi:AraC-like DNA-binding protein